VGCRRSASGVSSTQPSAMPLHGSIGGGRAAFQQVSHAILTPFAAGALVAATRIALGV